MANPYAQYVEQPKVASTNPYAQYAPSAMPAEAADAPGANSIPRLVGQGAIGANDAIANTLGAPVDLVAAGLRQLGIGNAPPTVNGVLNEQITGQAPAPPAPFGGSQSIKSGIDYVATLPQRIGDALSQGSISPLTEDRTSRFEPGSRGEKIANKLGEGVGTVASTLLPAGWIARAAAPGTVTQGIAQTLASQPLTQLASGAVGGATTGATDNPLLGLAASLATPLAVGAVQKAVTPVLNQLGPQEQNLVNAAQRAGITLTPAQVTGSRGLEGLERTMEKMPLTQGPMRSAFEGQHGQYNAAVLDKAGITANNAGPQVIGRAFEQQGKTFEDLAARTNISFDQPFFDQVEGVVQKYGRRLDTNIAPVFRSYLDDITKLAGSNQPGQSYANIRSDITRTMRDNAGNKPLRRALGGLVESLDDAMERASGPQARGEWQDARRQYQALMTVSEATAGGTQGTRSAADIPYGALTGSVRKGDKVGFAQGEGQLNELARIGDYLAGKVPDSGTPTRTAWQNLLTGGVGGGGALALGYSPGTAALAAGGSVALPWVTSRLYNSAAGRAYLTNQLAGRTDLGAAIGQQALQQGLQSGSQNSAIARALMRGNEQRAR